MDKEFLNELAGKALMGFIYGAAVALAATQAFNVALISGVAVAAVRGAASAVVSYIESKQSTAVFSSRRKKSFSRFF